MPHHGRLERIWDATKSVVKEAWGALAHDDIAVLRDPKASWEAKVAAGADLAATLVPDGALAKTFGKLVAKEGLKEALKIEAKHALKAGAEYLAEKELGGDGALPFAGLGARADAKEAEHHGKSAHDGHAKHDLSDRAREALPAGIQVRAWHGDVQTGRIIYSDGDVAIQNAGRNSAVVYDVERNLHGQRPPENAVVTVQRDGQFEEQRRGPGEQER